MDVFIKDSNGGGGIMDRKNKMKPATAVAVGIALGVAIGVAMDNISVGIGLGIAFGVVFGGFRIKKNPPDA